jgi:hypothetical protein
LKTVSLQKISSIGHGVYIYDNFEVFEGELKSRFKEGIYRYLDGLIYEGDWKFNRKHMAID